MINDITDIEQLYVKCYMDKTRVFMIENFLTTYDMFKQKKVPFNLFPKQKEFLTALKNHQNNITTKPRQAGVTTTTAAFLTCEIVLANPKSPETILVIGNKLDLAQQMITKIKEFVLQIPRWFWGDEYYSPDPKNDKNKKDIFVTRNKSELELFNGCKVVAKSSGENAARGVSSVSWLVFDEAAFIEKGPDVYAQAVATTSTGGHIIMISTPCGKDALYYKTYSQAIQGKNGYNVTEIRWYQDPRYNKFLKWTKKNTDTGDIEVEEEETINVDGSVRHDQNRWDKMLHDGYKPTSPWYLRMCTKLNNDEQKIAQELDVSFIGSANNVIEAETIEMQLAMNVREPDDRLKDHLVEETWVWKPPYENHRYVLCCDPSGGDSADRTAIEIIDLDGIDDNGMPCIEQVLEYNGKKLGDEIGQMIYQYASLYNEAFVIVEAIGGYGNATLLTLMSLNYKNLYYDDPNLTKYIAQREATSATQSTARLPGFHTSSVRFPMLSHFANMIKTNQFKIRSKRVISELETWIYKKSGKMDHLDSAHDDLLTCLAMGLFVIEFSISKIQANKSKDVAIIKAWISSSNIPIVNRDSNSISVAPKNTSPFYDNRMIKKYGKDATAYGWLFSK